MARAGMTNVIRRLRALTDAGTADYTLDGVAYWSDDQLQDELDRAARILQGEPLEPVWVTEDGAARLYSYAFPFGRHFEEQGPGAGWAVRNLIGGEVSGYTVDYALRRITFAADQRGAFCTLDARAFNLEAAAARVWEHKAAFAASKLDWNADGRRVRGSQEHRHCRMMAAHFRRLAGVRVSRMRRVDEV
jgi:hypothetical protein